MADTRRKVTIKAGVLPEVRQIKRPDISALAADMEKTDKSGAAPEVDRRETALLEDSLEAQRQAGEEGSLDEDALSDAPLWYVAHTYSGYENKVRANLLKTIENRHLENQIFEVRVPMQDVIEIKNGERKPVSKKMFPGYVLVCMIMTDETWYIVRNTRGVTGFVGPGPGSKPIPLTEDEVKSLGIYESSVSADFDIGDQVAVIAGVWKGSLGVVNKMDFSKETATINLELFGRETPVTISFDEIRKA